ncbi:MAG: ABC-2 family transporter protein [Elusimicrobiota bacterium]
MRTLRRYARIWWRLAAMSFSETWNTRINSLGWLLGKLVRLIFFFIFIVAIFKHTDSIHGYTLPEASLFFLTFNVVDLLAQLLFRGIYGLRRIVTEGELDFYLVQPVNVLFRVACQTVDFLDCVVAVPVLALTAWAIAQLPAGTVTPGNLTLYILLIANGTLIAFAMHVLVAALAVYSQQMENAIWLYRDLMVLGRFPVDIYAKGMQMVLTFLVPIAVMTSFPTKALIGLLSARWIAYALLLSTVSIGVSLWLWLKALAHYSSVSS